MRSQRNMAQMKEQNKTLEKELNKMVISNLSDTEFKALVIKMLRGLIEYSHKIKEEMKDTLREIKKNLQGTNREGKVARIISMIWNIMKKEAFNQNSKEQTEF